MRHRYSIKDISILLAGLLIAAFLCFEIDIFKTEGQASSHEKSIELDEVMLLAALLCGGLMVFSWRRLIEQKQETRRRGDAERVARELASQDPLTGLANRRKFGEALQAALDAPPRAGGAHALLMLDLNGFKQVNDAYGHSAGDETLRTVSRRLQGLHREGDVVARLGGDEFAVIAHHLAGPEAATSIGLRIIDALTQPIATGSVKQQIGTGIGICLFPFDEASAEEVMRRADVALYRAKGEHRSAMRFFDEDMDRNVRERASLERELRLAIQNGDVRPFFQPLVDLKSKQVVGFEALARWNHKELGSIPPDRFIPVAEDAGLMGELTDSLLEASCKAAREWPSNVLLAFNISPSQLKDRTFGLRVLTILGRTGLLPNRLEIEITESALVRDLDAAKEILGALREAGVRIALDDFGTGYSSLYHLRNFKLDKIKIDRSFVASMHSEKESAEIVAALVGLGHGLGLTITAEGIEDAGQESDLLAKGCQQGQGFLFSQAVPSSETTRFFEPAFLAGLDLQSAV